MATLEDNLDPNDRSQWFWPRNPQKLAPEAWAPLNGALGNGVRLGRLAETGKAYSVNAFVPKGPWTSLEIPPPGNGRRSRSTGRVPRCGVFRFPGFDEEQWQQIQCHRKSNRAQFDRTLELLTNAVISDADRLFGALDTTVSHGFNWNKGNELTVTFDYDRSNYPGLHVDSWEGAELEQRADAKTRICVNFGPGERFFLYVPLTLRQILACLPSDIRRRGAENSKSAIVEFFTRYPNAPVIRLLVPPGHGYFADTDNMIHDGSTESIGMGNTHLTLRGRYKGFDEQG